MSRHRDGARGPGRNAARGFRGPVALLYAATIVLLVVAVLELDAVYVTAFVEGVANLLDGAIDEYASLCLVGRGADCPLI